jgi:AraC family transcriptional regulator
MKEITREIYRERILDALQHVEENLDRDLTIGEIASAAHFSTYHFCRVFSGVTGETPAALVRRLRLERAACRMLAGSEPLVVIAMRAGYDSNSSFTRAFIAAFGETPSQFRSVRKSPPSLPAPSGYHYCPEKGIRTFIPVARGDTLMDGRIVDLEPMRVLCVRHIGPYNEIGEAFGRLGGLVARIGLDVSRSQWLAIYNDDPDTVPSTELRSDACVTLGEGARPDCAGEASILTIQGGMYATTRHTGSYSGLGSAWNDFMAGWIPRNGYRPRFAPCFEIYVKGSEDGCPESEYLTDIYEPVEPLS